MTDFDVIQAHLEAIRAGMAHQDAELAEVKSQTMKTNGSVRDLQIWRARIEGAASATAWRGVVATGSVIAIVTAIATALIAHFVGY